MNVFAFFKCWKGLFFQSLSSFATNLKPLKNTAQEVGPPPVAHLHSHTVKPELQERVLHSILSGQTNYSPFWKMHLSSSSMEFSSPALHQACPPLSIYCFPFGSPERNGHGDRELGYLCYLRLSRIQALNELPLWLHRPQNSGKYSPVVFPQDLWYSCPQYPHNAFVEFPKWMKSRFIWTRLRSKTQIFLITARLLHITV